MSSHRQIFKSTALIGGTQVINMAISILRTKVLAMLLGPAGMGLSGLYMTATGLVGSVAGLGLNGSGVRQIAEAAATNDQDRIARTIITLRRVSFISGIIGMLLVLALAPLLSRTTFGDGNHVFGISLMALTLLFASISAGQCALLQGLRQLKDLASSQILGAIAGAAASVALVWWLREDGIVPSLVAVSVFSVVLSWWFARKVPTKEINVTWRQTLSESRSLLAMGLALTTAGLIASGTAYITRVIVQRQLGIEAVGIYTATWTLSSYYVNIILSAMGADFMPRLTGTKEAGAANKLITEQTEMGILIAGPGVIATLTLAPWIMHLFYSQAFVAGAEVTRWQILGVFLRVVSWPMGYALIAKGKSFIFTCTELISGIVGMGLLLGCAHLWKLDGIGIYFVFLYAFYTVMMALVLWKIFRFRWSPMTLRILGAAILMLAATFIGTRLLSTMWSTILGMTMTILASLASALTLQKLLGVDLLRLIRSKLGGNK